MRKVNPSKTYLSFAVIHLMIVLGGCAQLQKMQQLLLPKDSVDSSQLLIANLPSYVPGEFFAYDSGLSMIVTESSGGKVAWQYSNGSTSRGYMNFLIPELAWEGEDRSGKAVTAAAADFLWPLALGKSGEFVITQSIVESEPGIEDTTTRRWECSVDGTERVSVPAGNFDAYVVSCNRYAADSNGWRGRHTYYYSPDIQHYVRLDKEYDRRPSRTEQLVSHGFNTEYLSQKEQAEAKKLLYQTLDKGGQGLSVNWSSSSGSVNVMLIPYQHYTGAMGQQCREYRSVFNVGGRVSQHMRKACQVADGTWQRTDT